MAPSFVHLHLHSEFSLTDSTLRIPELVARCTQLGLPALAVTDDGNLFALVKFFKAAEGAGLKPIAGADLWLFDDTAARGSDGREAPPSRLTVLCQDRRGYLSLSRLLSRAYLEGHRGDYVAIRPEWLLGDAEGLVVLAGRHSLPGQLLAAGRRDAAERVLEQWSEAFPDRLYLELVRTRRDGEEAFNTAAIHL